MQHSQKDEQRYILAYFNKRVGTFLDIGANDGITFSNTFALSVWKWHGLCLEPSPHNVALIQNLYRDNPRVKVLPVALAAHDGTVTFHEATEDRVHNLTSRMLGTTEPAHIEKWTAGGQVQYSETTVATISPITLLDLYPPPYEFVTVDTEGNSVDLFKLLPLSTMKTELVCVEHDGRQGEVIAHAAEHGLKNILYQNGINILIGVK